MLYYSGVKGRFRKIRSVPVVVLRNKVVEQKLLFAFNNLSVLYAKLVICSQAVFKDLMMFDVTSFSADIRGLLLIQVISQSTRLEWESAVTQSSYGKTDQ